MTQEQLQKLDTMAKPRSEKAVKKAEERKKQQEDKQLLLQDLCGRLSYGVIVHFDGWNPEKLTQVDLREFIFNDMGGIPIPYLRPMSSMTEEEKEEYKRTFEPVYDVDEYGKFFKCDYGEHTIDTFDWLNKNMFDYRGLIERNLAIDCSNLNIYD